MPPLPNPQHAKGPHGISSLDKLRTALQERLGQRKYQNWFGSGGRIRLAGSELTLCIQSSYLVKWIQKQFEPELLEIAGGFIGSGLTLKYEVGAEVVLSPIPQGTSKAQPAPKTSLTRKTTSTPAPTAVHGRSKRLYSLSEFVVGSSNELAFAGIEQFLTDPDAVAPLYLHAAVGNGKTHLLEGLHARMRKTNPQLQVMHITAENFGNYFSQALSSRTLPSFRTKFRSVDVLLVDDVDFFDGKKGFQEEFLHTVKHFEQEGRSLAVTSNRHPRLLMNTSEELISRYLSGLVCRIENPDEVTRREVVARRAAKLKCKFSNDALEYVSRRFVSSIRELEGAVNVLATWSQMSGSRVTIQAARKLLGRLERDCVRLVRVQHVESAICEFFGLQSDDLKSSSRKQAVSQPRMLAMYLSRKLTQSAYSEIGQHFGGRNHSTVISAEKKVTKQVDAAETIKVGAESWSLQDLLQILEDRIRAA